MISLCRFCLVLLIFPSGVLADEKTAVDSSKEEGDGVHRIILETNYFISGQSKREWFDSITKHRKPGFPPSGYTANTESKLDWYYSFSIDENECRLKAFEVNVKVHFTFPKIKSVQGLAPSSLELWQTYEKALRQHETGHAELAIQAAREMKTSVDTKSWVAKERPLLIQEIDDHCRRILQKYKKLQKEYDNTTAHGEKQGADLFSELYRNPSKQTTEIPPAESTPTTSLDLPPLRAKPSRSE